MNTDNWDEEFGPNILNKCPHCGAKLDKGQICWDIEKESHKVVDSLKPNLKETEKWK